MEEKNTEAKKFVLNYGLLLGILSVLLGVIMYVTNNYLEPGAIFGIISFIIMAVVISLGVKAYKKENNQFLRLGEALKVGIGIAVVAGILQAIWSLVLMNFLEPDFMNQMLEVGRENMLKQNPNMTEEQINQAMEFSASFSSPWLAVAISLIGSLFFGLIISLVAGLIMKNENRHNY